MLKVLSYRRFGFRAVLAPEKFGRLDRVMRFCVPSRCLPPPQGSFLQPLSPLGRLRGARVWVGGPWRVPLGGNRTQKSREVSRRQ